MTVPMIKAMIMARERSPLKPICMILVKVFILAVVSLLYCVDAANVKIVLFFLKKMILLIMAEAGNNYGFLLRVLFGGNVMFAFHGDMCGKIISICRNCMNSFFHRSLMKSGKRGHNSIRLCCVY